MATKMFLLNLFLLFIAVSGSPSLQMEPKLLHSNTSLIGNTRMVPVVQQAADSSRSTDGWGLLEVQPSAFLSALYKGTFAVSVYRQANVLEDMTAQFYYVPALVIDPRSATCALNNFNKRYEVTFGVIMYDEDFVQFVHAAINQKVGLTVPRHNLRVLPIESFRIDSREATLDYEIMNQWTSYASQQALVEFRLRFLKSEACLLTATNIANYPKQFVSDLTVYYSLHTQKSAKRRIQIKAEHVQNGNMFSSLQQTLPGKDIVYLQADDVKQLTLEIATEVMATEVTDDEFVSQDQSLTISNLLTGLLKIRLQSTENFDAQMWESVFWNDDNARPDKVSATLNELYNKSNEKIQEIIKKQVSTENSGGTTSGFNFLDLVKKNSESNSSSKKLTDDELQKLFELLTEHKEVTRWEGEAFVPKALQLSRTNLAALRATDVVTSVQVSVTKTVSELNTGINLLDPSPSVSAMMLQRDELHRLRMKVDEQVGSLKQEVVQLQNKSTSLDQEVVLLKNESTALSSKLPPTGTIRMIYAAAIPAGWMRCDGRAIDCSRYGALCNHVGANTPDFRGRFPVMKSDGATYGNTIGAIGGEQMVRLTEAEMPSHSHRYDKFTFFARNKSPYTMIHFKWNDYYRDSDYAGNTDEYTVATGGSQPHNNLPPFLTVEFIIKT